MRDLSTAGALRSDWVMRSCTSAPTALACWNLRRGRELTAYSARSKASRPMRDLPTAGAALEALFLYEAVKGFLCFFVLGLDGTHALAVQGEFLFPVQLEGLIAQLLIVSPNAAGA